MLRMNISRFFFRDVKLNFILVSTKLKVTDNMRRGEHRNNQGAESWSLWDATAQGGFTNVTKNLRLTVNYKFLTVCNSLPQSCLYLDESGWSALSGQAWLIKLRLRGVHPGMQPNTRRNWIQINSSTVCIYTALWFVIGWFIAKLAGSKRISLMHVGYWSKAMIHSQRWRWYKRVKDWLNCFSLQSVSLVSGLLLWTTAHLQSFIHFIQSSTHLWYSSSVSNSTGVIALIHSVLMKMSFSLWSSKYSQSNKMSLS